MARFKRFFRKGRTNTKDRREAGRGWNGHLIYWTSANALQARDICSRSAVVVETAYSTP